MMDEHFDKAVNSGGRTGDFWGMQPPAATRTETHEKSRTSINARENVTFAEIAGHLENARVAEEGLERNDATNSQANNLRHSVESAGPFSGPFRDGNAAFPPDLQTVINAWSSLSGEDRSAVLAIIRPA